MGSNESKAQLSESLRLLASRRLGKDEVDFFDNLLATQCTRSELFAVFSPGDLRIVFQKEPFNLCFLFKRCLNYIEDYAKLSKEIGSGIRDPSKSADAYQKTIPPYGSYLNAVRVLTALTPILYEGIQLVPPKYRKSNIAYKYLCTASKSEEKAASIAVPTEPKSADDSAYSFSDPLSEMAEKTSPLARAVRATLSLCFVPGFTCADPRYFKKNPIDGKYLSGLPIPPPHCVLWESGLLANVPSYAQPPTRHEIRYEVLSLMLVLICGDVFKFEEEVAKRTPHECSPELGMCALNQCDPGELFAFFVSVLNYVGTYPQTIKDWTSAGLDSDIEGPARVLALGLRIVTISLTSFPDDELRVAVRNALCHGLPPQAGIDAVQGQGVLEGGVKGWLEREKDKESESVGMGSSIARRKLLEQQRKRRRSHSGGAGLASEYGEGFEHERDSVLKRKYGSVSATGLPTAIRSGQPLAMTAESSTASRLYDEDDIGRMGLMLRFLQFISAQAAARFIINGLTSIITSVVVHEDENHGKHRESFMQNDCILPPLPESIAFLLLMLHTTTVLNVLDQMPVTPHLVKNLCCLIEISSRGNNISYIPPRGSLLRYHATCIPALPFLCSYVLVLVSRRRKICNALNIRENRCSVPLMDRNCFARRYNRVTVPARRIGNRGVTISPDSLAGMSEKPPLLDEHGNPLAYTIVEACDEIEERMAKAQTGGWLDGALSWGKGIWSFGKRIVMGYEKDKGVLTKFLNSDPQFFSDMIMHRLIIAMARLALSHNSAGPLVSSILTNLAPFARFISLRTCSSLCILVEELGSLGVRQLSSVQRAVLFYAVESLHLLAEHTLQGNAVLSLALGEVRPTLEALLEAGDVAREVVERVEDEVEAEEEKRRKEEEEEEEGEDGDMKKKEEEEKEEKREDAEEMRE
ncbi:Hid-1/Ecm30 like protein, partial [Aduncisulcus paluster]